MDNHPRGKAEGALASHPAFKRKKTLSARQGTILIVLLTGVLVIMLGYAMRDAAPVFIPLILALLLNLVLYPVMRTLVGVGLPRTLAAILVMSLLMSAIAGGVYSLSAPASHWLDQAPETFDTIRYKLRGLEEPIDKVKKASESIRDIAGGEGASQVVSLEQGGIYASLLEGAPNVLAGLLLTAAILFFMLVSGNAGLRKLVRVLPRFGDRRAAVRIVRDIQRDISTYLGTITVINVGLGASVAGAMWLCDMPNPVLWGVMVGMFNFVPYLGAMVSVSVIAVVALVSFDSLTSIALPPLLALTLTSLEGQLVTPALAGRRLDIAPLANLLALVVFGWLWGIVGALMAIPLLVSFKLTCAQIRPLRPIADILHEERRS